MGVKNLWDILESCKKKLPLSHLQNKRVCIDLSCWIVQLHQVHKSHSAPKEKLYLKSLFHRLRALIALNCSLIFVADGSIPAIKLSTYRRRLTPRTTEVTQDEPRTDNISALRRNMGSEFSCMIKDAKALGMALGIPCLDGIEEAEAQCALLDMESLCDGCFTSDSDVFLFGARTVYRDICLSEGGYVICYEMTDIESTLGFGRNSLISLALLLGGDYSNGVRGIGQESACQILKAVGDDVILKKIASEGLSFVRKSKGSKKQAKGCQSRQNENAADDKLNALGNERNLEQDEQFLQVISAYLKPRCHSADSDAVYSALSVYPFKCIEIQQICQRFFEWPPEQTDEYILPKIAERDLRRLANLRSTSSALGIQTPVKCSVLAIIKPRKLQGEEYFQVSWSNFHGLQSSVVPADLIKRACPEKIIEFEERKAQKKNQNRKKTKSSKSQNKSPTSELDQQLRNLLLDINSQTHMLKSNTRADSLKADLAGQDSITEQKLNSSKSHDSSIYFHASCSLTTEVIDLLSPSPPVRARKVSKGREAATTLSDTIDLTAQCVDVIDLSDSELDASPEHARKARELRSFIASVRDDISWLE
uniref:Single-strand DNA endonuclease 1 n=1 Tax=Kalanchoe fedtschenkoi TaxID=63787 RepID=A0A7N0V2Y0_KALFE